MKHFWVGRMDAMANASPALYYLFAWLLAAIGYGYLMLFPILAGFAVAFVGYMVSQSSPRCMDHARNRPYQTRSAPRQANDKSRLSATGQPHQSAGGSL